MFKSKVRSIYYCHREECLPYGQDDVAISVVGGNDEIATSFCGRTRNDNGFLSLQWRGEYFFKTGCAPLKLP